jgi:hypothetical protein
MTIVVRSQWMVSLAIVFAAFADPKNTTTVRVDPNLKSWYVVDPIL